MNVFYAQCAMDQAMMMMILKQNAATVMDQALSLFALGSKQTKQKPES